MIDKLSLTVSNPPDYEYLKVHGELVIDEYRRQIYKEMWKLKNAVVFCKPHKYSEKRNENISFVKVDLNPKFFSCYDSMWSCLCLVFGLFGLQSNDFKVSRIDVAADIEGISIESVLCSLHVKRISTKNFRFYRGTIYIGKNPEIVIYNKIESIKFQIKEGKEITAYDQSLLTSGKNYTRFEIRSRPEKLTLRDVLKNHISLASYFDGLEIFNFNDNEITGFMQFIYRSVNRKMRGQLEVFKDVVLVNKIKEDFINSTVAWFKPVEEPF